MTAIVHTSRQTAHRPSTAVNTGVARPVPETNGDACANALVRHRADAGETFYAADMDGGLPPDHRPQMQSLHTCQGTILR